MLLFKSFCVFIRPMSVPAYTSARTEARACHIESSSTNKTVHVICGRFLIQGIKADDEMDGHALETCLPYGPVRFVKVLTQSL